MTEKDKMVVKDLVDLCKNYDIVITANTDEEVCFFGRTSGIDLSYYIFDRYTE